MDKKPSMIKKILIGVLIALGVLFIIVMLMPDDDENEAKNISPDTNTSQKADTGKLSSDKPSATAKQDSESGKVSADKDNDSSASKNTDDEEKISSGSDSKHAFAKKSGALDEVEPVSVGKDAKSATIMVYVNGSDLESEYEEASTDISEMVKSGIGKNVNVIIQTMGTKKWHSYNISSKTAQTWKIENGGLTLLRDKLGQLDSTSSSTLSEFIGYCKNNYPADRYIFLFWDHGGGPVYGFGYDQWQDEDASLTISEMAEAFSKNKDIHFDFIGMDCCIMASLETCYALAPYCKYTILSEDFESGQGWSYTDWMSKLEENPGLSTTVLGKNIIDSIITANETEEYGDSACMSMFNESTIPGLFTAWKEYAYKNESALLGTNYSRSHKAKRHGKFGGGFWDDFFDAWNSDESDVTLSDYFISDMLAIVENTDSTSDEAKALTSALKAAVSYYGHTQDKNELTGMSVSLPYGDSDFYGKLKQVYSDIGIDSEYITWLKKFVSSSGNDNYYDYDDFDDSWDGWGSYEDEYGFGSFLNNPSDSWFDDDYGWGYGYDDYYSDDDGYYWDDDDYYYDDDDYYYDDQYYYDDYCNYDYRDYYDYGNTDSYDDWLYDYEEELWYMFGDGGIYFYDDVEDMMYFYDEEYDEYYYYDETEDDWVIMDD